MNLISERFVRHLGPQPETELSKPGILLRYLLILLQLAVVSWLIIRYGVEPDVGIPQIVPIVLVGFVIHSLLPFSYRLPFLIFLSIGAVFWLVNWLPGLAILALFAIFFGILQLPVSVTIRTVLTLLAGAALGYVWVRHAYLIPEAYQVVPVIGSIFMFRSTIYLYDIRHEKTPLPFRHRLVYFFMLPNFVFTLFPIVDYKVFGKSYYNEAPLDIYQRGVRWLIRGFFHLMLYRVVYYYIQPPLGEVEDLHSYAFYGLTSYIQILRLSGLFHAVVGILCLFGYNLPRTFHNYFFSTGFSDLWRRVNIYWRDYIMKLYYYPLYFKIRRIGNVNAMVVAILFGFGVTWVLHDYQLFWLRGTWPCRAVDAIFWGTFGVLVAAESVYQQKVPKKKQLKVRLGYVGQTAIRSLQIVGMMSFMSVLWTFWNSVTIASWLRMLKSLDAPTGMEVFQLGLIILGAAILLFIGFYLFDRTRLGKFIEPSESGNLSVFWGSLTLVAFSLLCIPSVLNIFQPLTEKPIDHIYAAHLTEQDDVIRIQGYYEDILVTGPVTNPLGDFQNRPDDWVGLAETDAGYSTDDWRIHDLLPNVQTIFKSQPLTTNQWAMRDKEYSREKPERTFRIAIMGGSYVMGSGVGDSAVFDAVLEEGINQDTASGITYEFLNFALPGQHLLHHAFRLEEKVVDFQPDVVMFISHGVDFNRVYQAIVAILHDGSDYPLPFLGDILEKYDLEPGVEPNLRQSQQMALAEEVVTSTLDYISGICSEKGIQPAVSLWPRTNRPLDDKDVNDYFQMVKEHGFLVIDMADVYSEYTAEELMIAKFDGHPNDLGHQLIAERLQKVFQTDPEWIEMARKMAE